MSNVKSNLIVIALTAIVSCSLTYYLLSANYKQKNETTTVEAIEVTSKNDIACNYKLSRLGGYKLIRPLMTAEPTCESSKYQNIKLEVEKKIDDYKKSGQLISASVYLRDFELADWICVNDTETYLPGSLIKVIGMITYLKMAEAHPGLLDKKLTFDSPKEFIPNQTFSSKQVELGKTYTIKELLKYMIAYSDNNATYLLNKNADLQTFKKVFKDFNIPSPDFTNNKYKITVKDFSLFFKIIYNAGYLTIEDSEYAAELLEECDFSEGFKKGVPQNVKIIHKFGEMGDATTRQLHESGIFYVENKPYLLTVLTKGYDVKKMPQVLSSISKIVYENMTNSQLASK